MTEDEKKEFEEFLKWKQEKSNQTERKSDEKINGVKDNVQQRNNSHSKLGKGLGCGCLSIIIFIVFIALLPSGNKDGVVDWSNAVVMSEHFIKDYMKFPDDVKFIGESRNVSEEGNNIYKITGRLKANNVYGQAIPYSYNIRIQYNGGKWNSKINWTLLGGNLYNEATQEFTELQ